MYSRFAIVFLTFVALAVPSLAVQNEMAQLQAAVTTVTKDSLTAMARAVQSNNPISSPFSGTYTGVLSYMGCKSSYSGKLLGNSKPSGSMGTFQGSATGTCVQNGLTLKFTFSKTGKFSSTGGGKNLALKWEGDFKSTGDGMYMQKKLISSTTGSFKGTVAPGAFTISDGGSFNLMVAKEKATGTYSASGFGDEVAIRVNGIYALKKFRIALEAMLEGWGTTFSNKGKYELTSNGKTMMGTY